MGALVSDPQFYKGAIACVQIYNKSLSEQEISAVKDRGPIEGRELNHNLNELCHDILRYFGHVIKTTLKLKETLN